jgi:hypothetical protein
MATAHGNTSLSDYVAVATGGAIKGKWTNLVEITALSALIGSDTAEQLTLGNRGAAGLAWVGLSIFGSLSTLRACLTAATPSWLRGSLGLRSGTRDAAIGMMLNLCSPNDREHMARKNLGGRAVGLVCERKKSVSRAGDLQSLNALIKNLVVVARDI